MSGLNAGGRSGYGYEPHIRNLHRQVYDQGRGRPAPLLDSGPGEWERMGKNTHFLEDDKDAFGVLPGKFFKHLQVLRPFLDEPSLLDEAEARNPALKDQKLNKKGQTLRERYASLNTQVPPAPHSRSDRTSSLDEKRVVLLKRAIAHYEGLARGA